MSQVPRVFISYSHDSELHKEWVYGLACALLKNGVDVTLDQFDIKLGSNLTSFMEKGPGEADRVIVVCTDEYNSKANGGHGGVGYEKLILTAELFRHQDTDKFIPCVRGAADGARVPAFLGNRAYVDFTDDAMFEAKLTELLADLHGVRLRPKPELGENPFAKQALAVPRRRDVQPSTAYFHSRMGAAFPGVRGIRWFDDPIQAAKRLELLFGDNYGEGGYTPIWWWRDGEISIDSFRKDGDALVLLGPEEFLVRRLAAVISPAYFRSFVYVETSPMPPTHLVPGGSIEEQVKHRGYAREEFALLGTRIISREEYDDGAAEIDGEVRELGDGAELRVRYLTPFNFILAAQGHPINNGSFDAKRTELLGAMLRGEATIEQMAAALEPLPKRGTGAI